MIAVRQLSHCVVYCSFFCGSSPSTLDVAVTSYILKFHPLIAVNDLVFVSKGGKVKVPEKKTVTVRRSVRHKKPDANEDADMKDDDAAVGSTTVKQKNKAVTHPDDLNQSSKDQKARRLLSLDASNGGSFSFRAGEVLPSLRDSSLSTLGLQNVTVDEVLAKFEDAVNSVPALYITGALALDDGPLRSVFQRLGLRGGTHDFELYLFPWKLGSSTLQLPSDVIVTLPYRDPISLLNGDLTFSDIRLTMRYGWLTESTGFQIDGDVSLALPFLDDRLDFDGTLRVDEGSRSISLRCEMDAYSDAFGISNLDLTDLSLSADLSAISGSDFQVSSSFAIRNSCITFQLGGIISSNLVCFRAFGDNLTATDLSSVFSHFFGVSLFPLDVDFRLSDVSIAVTSADCQISGVAIPKGVSLQATVDCGAFTNLHASLVLSDDGMRLTASLPGDLPSELQPPFIEFGDMDLAISLVPTTAVSDAGQSSYFSLKTSANLFGIPLQTEIYIQSDPVAFTLLAVIPGFQLSKLLPLLRGTPFDFLFDGVTITWTSGSGKASSSLPAQVASSYPHLSVAESSTDSFGGTLLVSGSISTVPGIPPFLNIGSISAVFSCALDRDHTAFSLALQIGVAKIGTFSLHSISMEVQQPREGPPVVGFNIEMDFLLPGNTQPSRVIGTLRLDVIELKIAASFVPVHPGYPAWPNAFGVKGFDLDNLVLSGGLNPETGIPIEIGFAASMHVRTRRGRSYELDVAVALGPKPEDLLLKLFVAPLDFELFSAIAELMSGQTLNELTDITELIDQYAPVHIESRDVQFSEGATIGAVHYPPGIQMVLNGTLFQRWGFILSGKLSTRTGAPGLSLLGEMQGMSIGPLAITGVEGPNPQFGFNLAPGNQSIFIDAQMSLLKTFLVGVFFTLSRTSFEFVFSVHLLPPPNGLSLDLTARASYETGSTIFDPVSASYALSASVDISGLKNVVTDVVKRCLPSLRQVLQLGSVGLAMAQTQYENSVQYAQKQVQFLSDQAAAAEKAFEDAGRRLLSAGLDAVNQLEVVGDRITVVAAEGQKSIDTAISDGKKLVQVAQNALDAVTTAVQKAVADALSTLTYAEHYVTSLGGLLPTQSRRSMHILEAWRWESMSSLEDAPIQVHNGTAVDVGWKSRRLLLSLGDVVDTYHTVVNTISPALQGAQDALTAAQDAYNKAKDAAATAIANAKAALQTAKDTASRLEQQARSTATALSKDAQSAYNRVSQLTTQVTQLAQIAKDTAETVASNAKAAASAAQSALPSVLAPLETAWAGAQTGFHAIQTTTGSFVDALSDPSTFVRIDQAGVGSDFSDLADHASISLHLAGSIVKHSFDFHLDINFDVSGASNIISKATDWISSIPGLEVCGAQIN
jgi:hypothetical protein